MNAKDEVKSILINYRRTQTWLAEKLGIQKQTLNYMLNGSKGLDTETYKQIIKIFKREKMITSAGDKCDHIRNQTMEVNAILGSSLTLLNNTVKKVSEDNILDFKEKKQLSEMIDELRESLNHELDKISEMIER